MYIYSSPDMQKYIKREKRHKIKLTDFTSKCEIYILLLIDIFLSYFGIVMLVDILKTQFFF